MTGGGAKIARVRLAAHSYFEDQVERSEGVVVTYEVAGGLFAASATLLTAALMIDITALFRCIQSNSGLGYAALSGMTTELAVLCVALAIYQNEAINATGRVPV
jgi:hypothetical protein